MCILYDFSSLSPLSPRTDVFSFFEGFVGPLITLTRRRMVSLVHGCARWFTPLSLERRAHRSRGSSPLVLPLVLSSRPFFLRLVDERDKSEKEREMEREGESHAAERGEGRHPSSLRWGSTPLLPGSIPTAPTKVQATLSLCLRALSVRLPNLPSRARWKSPGAPEQHPQTLRASARSASIQDRSSIRSNKSIRRRRFRSFEIEFN